MKIIITLENKDNLDSILSNHFGMCKYFGIYDTDIKKLNIIENTNDHSKEGETPAEKILKLNPDIIFTKDIGLKAINLFKENNIQLKTGPYNSAKEVINNIDNLKDILNHCNHLNHKNNH
jgi:predicted Fe-Mo cluster-binding NifX family protein